MSVATFRSHFILARETTYGSTSALGTRSIPVQSFDPGWKDIVDYTVDKGIRGAPSMDFAMYQGVRSGRWTGSHFFHPDVAGVFLRAMYGGETVSSTSAPFTHTFGTTDRPPSYSLYDSYGLVTGSSERIIRGAQLERLEYAFSRETGVLTVTPTWLGFGSTGVAAQTASYSTADPFRGWQATIAIAGTTNIRILELAGTLSRQVTLIYGGSNTQAPNDREVGPLEHTGSFVAYASTSLELDRYLANSTGALNVVLSDSTNSLTLNITDWRIEDVDSDRGSGFAKWDVQWRALHSATDTGPGSMALVVASSCEF